MRTLDLATAALSAMGVCLASCSSSGGAGPTNMNGTDAAPSDADVVDCSMDHLAEAYSPGMKAMGMSGDFQVQLVSVYVENAQGQQVQQPPAKGLNRWIVKVLDKSGNPVSGVTFPPETVTPWPSGWPIGVLPYMPYHGHAASTWPTMTDNMDGTFTIDGVNLFMAGVWQVTFHVKANSQTDSAVFGFCVPG
jgi:hypothetical protein